MKTIQLNQLKCMNVYMRMKQIEFIDNKCINLVIVCLKLILLVLHTLRFFKYDGQICITQVNLFIMSIFFIIQIG